MENLPAYISWVFITTTLLTLFFLYKASRHSKAVIIIALLWLAVQSIIANSKFYTETQILPPRFLLLVLPPFLLILILFVTAKGKAFIDRFDTRLLTWLHIVRVPVELVLFWLFVQQQIPQLMTFEGRNFDILSGLTAPVIAYFGYHKQKLNTTLLLVWNFLCLALLINIVANAVLSAPFPFQQFAFEQPNVAVLYFPFALLPAFIVPAVLFAHLVCIRRLLSKKKTTAGIAYF